MTAEIFRNIPMETDIESKWIPLMINNYGGRSNAMEARSMQISWEQAAGTLNGSIDIMAGNGSGKGASGLTFAVNSESNVNDNELIFMEPAFEFIKLVYTSGGITGGRLSAVLYYV